MKQLIDINADLGEGMEHDEAIMPYISSCSIACGGHFGDESTMRRAVRLATVHGVKVGAHPSFPDRDNFGRKLLFLSREDLSQSIFHQVLRFMAVCETEEAPLHHVKLHGALYNYAAADPGASDAVIKALERLKVRTILYCPFGSVLHKKAENLFPLKFEAFIDRRYMPDGRLVSRSHQKALITAPQQAWAQLQNIVDKGRVMSMAGDEVSIRATTFCIHGDNARSVEILKFIHKQMKLNQYALAE